ncbi:DUF551 domain-containing protein [Klebsiella pneumoniae]|uniref:DUF551 domain-containing protein n=1 Tax=Klebsiella pneumoniae TaxID=573 RepID=UPI0003BE2A7A|nr:DUF551 domain-containing protein [Klebsiella pneumoniae]ESL51187.1 hypothetical protein L460_02872 [Klebsiella pneumoniae BIDMC 24]ESL56721.1 hypothetical protein L460_00490 [Klebsiella pneumoniae BIDMC 24]
MTKSTITREESVQAVFDLKVGYRLGFADLEILKRVARMALAAMDSDPVAWLLSGGGAENVVRFDSGNAYADPLREVTPLYRHAQPALVVPKEMTAGIAVKYWEGGRGSIESFVAGYNFCRAAMLAAAPHDTPALNSVQSVVTGSDTWIQVSERMPEKGQAVLVYRPKAHEGGDSDVRVAVYGRHNFEHGFGCYWEPSHWMPLPAAPQEVGDA